MADPNDVKNKTVFDKHREKFKNEIDYHRYWKDLYEKERKLRQEVIDDNRKLSLQITDLTNRLRDANF